jgi:hypothetical protein
MLTKPRLPRELARFCSLAALAALTSLLCPPVEAQAQKGDEKTSNLAQAAQNPVADLISLPLQNNMNLTVGDKQVQNVLNVQPVIPIGIGPVNLVTRTILPVVWQPDVEDGSGGVFGLGDTQLSLFLSPSDPKRLIWGMGPIVLLPTRTNSALGAGKFGLGPAAVLLKMHGPWVVGVLAQNAWGFAGRNEVPDTNAFLLQYFVNYNFKKGWYAASAPILTANWNASSGEKWVVPFGAGAGKIFSIRKQPMNVSVQVYGNAVRPTGYAPVTLRLQLQLLFPT